MKNFTVPIIAVAGFTVPVLVAAVLNWEQIQPYVVVDPQTAEGHVLYLYAPS
jgi:hypothetical protein